MLPRAEAITFLIYESHENATLQYVFNVQNLHKMHLIQQHMVCLQPRCHVLNIRTHLLFDKRLTNIPSIIMLLWCIHMCFSFT